MTALRDQVKDLLTSYQTKIRDLDSKSQHHAGTGVILLGSASVAAETTGFPGVYDVPNGNTVSFNSVGAFTWANIFLGHRLELLKNYGTAGDTSLSVANRALALGELGPNSPLPRFAIVRDWWRDNFIGGSPRKSLASIQSDLDATIATLNLMGCLVVLCGPTPDTAITTTADKAAVAAIQRMTEEAGRSPGVIAVNLFDVLSSITGGWRPNYSPGSVLNTPGAVAAGAALAEALRPYVGGSQFLAYGADPNTVSNNPFMTGTGGALTPGLTGQLADSFLSSWNVDAAGTAVASKVARSDFGEWQQIKMTAAGTLLVGQGIDTGQAPVGSSIALEFEFETDPDQTGITMLAASLETNNGIGYHDARTSDAFALPLLGEGVMRTPVFTVPPTGVTSMTGWVKIAGAPGTVRIGRMRIRKGY